MNDNESQALERIAAALEVIAHKLAADNPAVTGIDDQGEDENRDEFDETLIRFDAGNPLLFPFSIVNSETTGVDNQEACGNGTTPPVNDINRILRFLSDRNIEVEAFRKDSETDEVLDGIALYMGTHYTQIKKVYTAIKSRISSDKGFWVDLIDETPDTVHYSCNLCAQLHQIAFLEHYMYTNFPSSILYAKSGRIPLAINFITGDWLERYIRMEVKNLIAEFPPAVRFAYLANPHIILPSGGRLELDFLFAVNDEIYWFEAKTGDYQSYVAKYSKMAKQLRLDRTHAVLVLADIDESRCSALEKVYGLGFVGIKQFPDLIRKAAERFFPTEQECASVL
ncbi:MAG: hypothetical protein LBR29_01395 [Methylobacteriaceae bacterium]|jgi:hypothetical protein|nr:hypothetical protein [Methylobacteriaceae bacterium]